VKQMLTELFI